MSNDLRSIEVEDIRAGMKILVLAKYEDHAIRVTSFIARVDSTSETEVWAEHQHYVIEDAPDLSDLWGTTQVSKYGKIVSFNAQASGSVVGKYMFVEIPRNLLISEVDALMPFSRVLMV